MINLEQLKTYREDILVISLTAWLRYADKYHAPNIRVFGSVVRGEATAESDVDFLIDVSPEQTLFDLIRLTRSLKELLGCEVDVAQSTVLHPRIKKRVLHDAICLRFL